MKYNFYVRIFKLKQLISIEIKTVKIYKLKINIRVIYLVF